MTIDIDIPSASAVLPQPAPGDQGDVASVPSGQFMKKPRKRKPRAPLAPLVELPFTLESWVATSDEVIVTISVRFPDGTNAILPGSTLFPRPGIAEFMDDWCLRHGLAVKSAQLRTGILAQLPSLTRVRTDDALFCGERDYRSMQLLREVFRAMQAKVKENQQ